MSPKRKKFDRLAKKAKKIIITAHKSPDEDAVCSMLAVYSYLRKVHPGPKRRMIISGEVSSRWDYLPFFDKIEWVKDLADHLGGAELVIFLDGFERERFSSQPDKIDLSKFKSICIDHHPEPKENFTLDLSRSGATSVCEIIAEILFDDDQLLNQKIIEILLVGILADSGGLRYINQQNSVVLPIVKRLIDLGKIELQNLRQKMEVISEPEFELIKILMTNTTNVKFKKIPGLTCSFLPKSCLKGYPQEAIKNARHRYMDMIFRYIEGYPWGFLVYPDADDSKKFHVGFRALPGAPNVRLLANRLGGGGHDQAAGGKYILKKGEEKLDSKDVCRRILEVVRSAKLELTSSS